jgi:hypothetical protein
LVGDLILSMGLHRGKLLGVEINSLHPDLIGAGLIDLLGRTGDVEVRQLSHRALRHLAEEPF